MWHNAANIWMLETACLCADQHTEEQERKLDAENWRGTHWLWSLIILVEIQFRSRFNLWNMCIGWWITLWWLEFDKLFQSSWSWCASILEFEEYEVAQNARSLYSLICYFLLSQINIWSTTTWSNVRVILPKPSCLIVQVFWREIPKTKVFFAQSNSKK